jgi:S-adenosylmethionine:tRNA ribosyltransferase-isomerase
MDLAEFDYNLPIELIAQTSIEPRDQARLMVVDRQLGNWQSAIFADLTKFLRPDDVLLINNSKVLPARLFGHKTDSGGRVEILLEQKITQNQLTESWRCLIGSTRPRPGLIIDLAEGLQAKVISAEGQGVFIVEFNKQGDDFRQIIYKIGQMPLPPYIKPDQAGLDRAVDDYQTVYANDDKLGSVAAPTAGLHFTDKLLTEIRLMGVEIIEATLHVGLGTFAPVKTVNIEEHRLHQEVVEIKAATINQLIDYKRQGRRLIAVGTTSVRILEGVVAQFINQPAGVDWLAPIDLFIYPGFEFKLLDGLITNFHLPKSSLIMLVSAWSGTDLIKQAYQAAIDQRYRFFSYGDAMLLI